MTTRDAPGSNPLRSRIFRLERQGSWLELEQLLDRIQAGGLESLSAQELEHFPILHRLAISSLSVARAIALDRALIDYLDNLALRSFLAVYTPPATLKEAVRDFVMRLLPAAVRELRWHVMLMAIILLLGVGSGFALVNGDEGWFESIVPSELAQGRGPLSTRSELQAMLTAGLPDPGATLAMIANDLFRGNTIVGLLMFGLGALAGVPSIILCFQQGLVLGAFLALHYHRGLLVQFSGWVSIHGVTELGALIIFGAAGLRLGELLVFPGTHSRVDNFALHAPTAGTAAVGAGAMLFIAAILEGFFRQAIVATDARLVIATATLLGWLWYFPTFGRAGLTK